MMVEIAGNRSNGDAEAMRSRKSAGRWQTVKSGRGEGMGTPEEYRSKWRDFAGTGDCLGVSEKF